MPPTGAMPRAAQGSGGALRTMRVSGAKFHAAERRIAQKNRLSFHMK